MTDSKPREVLFEYTQVGNSVRVTAIDAATGIEVTIQAPLNLGHADLQRTALRKLDYVMKKGRK
jgi:hypothetical protein